MTTHLLQIPIIDDPLAVSVLASSVAGPVPVLLDVDDAKRLGKKHLSLGSHGYAQLWYAGQSTPLHRWLLGAERGDGKIVDHLNGDPYDNRQANLRFVTAAENAANRRVLAASGFRGVHITPSGRFAARVKRDGHNYHLGVFSTPEEAAKVSHEWRTANLPGYVGRAIVATSRLFGACGHGSGPCGATPTRPYACGPRCAQHSPSALAGEPEPGSTTPVRSSPAEEAR